MRILIPLVIRSRVAWAIFVAAGQHVSVVKLGSVDALLASNCREPRAPALRTPKKKNPHANQRLKLEETAAKRIRMRRLFAITARRKRRKLGAQMSKIHY
jgi:hypothetical protein